MVDLGGSDSTPELVDGDAAVTHALDLGEHLGLGSLQVLGLELRRDGDEPGAL